MARHPRTVDEAIARFDDLAGRMDGRAPTSGSAASRSRARSLRSAARKVTRTGAALAALIVATIVSGLLSDGIGMTGLFIVLMLTVLIVTVGLWPRSERRQEYSEQLPTKTVIRQLDDLLVRRRAALPAPAARRADAIGQQLPLLESRLGEVDALDPLAQDARRLMGKHLPELIERYERVPAAYRHERDGDGLTVDERLVAGLDAARLALDEIGAKLAQEDLTAFKTQGRFIETRYKDGSEFTGT